MARLVALQSGPIKRPVTGISVIRKPLERLLLALVLSDLLLPELSVSGIAKQLPEQLGFLVEKHFRLEPEGLRV